MTASYKRKRLIEEDSSDKKPTAIRKQLNSSERIKTRSQIKKNLDDRLEWVQELRWELELEQSSECHHNEIFGPHTYMQTMLALLDVGDFDLYRCRCVDVFKIPDEQVLKMFGL
jgi:hypothetical protein